MTGENKNYGFGVDDFPGVAVFAEKDVIKRVQHAGGVMLSTKNKQHAWITDLSTSLGWYEKIHGVARERISNLHRQGFEASAKVTQNALIDNHEFQGLTVQTMLEHARGEIDLEPFWEARGKVRNFSGEVETYLKKARPGRRREFSSDDGDYIHERSWEIQPFATTSRVAALKIPRLTIICDVSFNCGVESSFIDRHCATAWALVDMFESVGILCSVYACSRSQNVSRHVQELDSFIELKRFDSYVSASNIARGMSAGFFRRIIFSYKVESAMLLGEDTHSGLGQPKSGGVPFFKNGTLFFGGRVTEKIEGMSPGDATTYLLNEMKPGLAEMGVGIQ